MKARIHSFFSSDEDLRTYVSTNPTDDGLWVRLIVGPAGGAGEESFDVLVCTPAWIQRWIAERGPQIGRHLLILDSLDLNVAESFLRRQIEKLDEPSWDELAIKIARLGYWEFEDYKA